MTDQDFQELVIKQLQTLTEGQQTLSEKVNIIDLNQIRMENELTEKIRGLYDSREVQNDVNERIISTLERLEAKIDVLQLETAHLRRVK
ncbi:MAG: hypothetical protein PHW39_08555 [Syntrophomonadaceae bacterium]|nr:hypothetical protein [Syntrophomonadaceae bacterium]